MSGPPLRGAGAYGIVVALQPLHPRASPPAPPKAKGDANLAIVIFGIFIGGPLLLAVFVAAISFGAIGANIAIGGSSHAKAQPTAHGNTSATRFSKAFATITVGDARTGKGGMTMRQVVALLGKPHPGDISVTHSGSEAVTTYTYRFHHATGALAWVVDFANGRVTDKSSR